MPFRNPFASMDPDIYQQMMMMGGLGMLGAAGQGANPMQALGTLPPILQSGFGQQRQRKLDREAVQKAKLEAEVQKARLAQLEQQRQQQLLEMNRQRTQMANVQAYLSDPSAYGQTPSTQLQNLAQATGNPEYMAMAAQQQARQQITPYQQAQLDLSQEAADLRSAKRETYRDPIGMVRYADTGEPLPGQGISEAELVAIKKRPLVSMEAEKEHEKGLAKLSVDRYKTITQTAEKARNRLNDYDVLRLALAQFGQTGQFGQFRLGVLRVAAGLGIDVDKKKLAAGELSETISNRLVLEARDTSAGAGMPGQMSDRDREFLQRIPPGITKTPEGNALILEVLMRKEKRRLEVAQLADRWVAAGGTLGPRFNQMIRERFATTTLFADLENRIMGSQQNKLQRDLERYGIR